MRVKVQERVKRQAGRRRIGESHDRTFADRRAKLSLIHEAAKRNLALVEGELADWASEARSVCEPFGLDFRTVEPAVVDVLAWCHPDGEHWRWTGRTNNKGLPVVRTRESASQNTEWSAIQVLHKALCDHEPPKAMHPRCGDRSCIRLAHRCPVCAEADA